MPGHFFYKETVHIKSQAIVSVMRQFIWNVNPYFLKKKKSAAY